MRWAVFAWLFAAPLHAETPYPEVGTTFVYETLTHQSGFEFAVQELTVTILHVQDDKVVYSYCVDDNPCSTNIRRDLTITDFGYYGPPISPSDQMIEQMRVSSDALPVETTDLSGAIFPMTDGQVIRWSEAWRSEGFNEDYAMSLSQICCTNSEVTQVSGEDLWLLEYSFHAAGDGGNGGSVSVYDPGLKWWIEQTFYQNVTGWYFRTEHSVLREIILP